MDKRRIAQALLDASAWVFAVCVVTWMRFDFVESEVMWRLVLPIAAVAGLLQIVAGYVLLLYRGRYKFGSFDEVTGVVASGSLVGLGLFFGVMFGVTRPVPLGAAALAIPVAMCLMLGTRFAIRAWRTRYRLSSGDREPVLIFGAGDAAEQLIKSMKTDSASPYWPVGLLDDDPSRQRLRLSGVSVLGTRQDLQRVASLNAVSLLIVGIARADSELLRDLVDATDAADMQIKVLPSVHDLPNSAVVVSDVRDIDEADLLGRQPIVTDLDAIAHFIHDRRVLITGAGGSIGSELARQIHRLGPAELGLLDRDESALHGVELSIKGSGLLVDENMILADIRDPHRLREVFQRFNPDVVFHAAALKHLPLLEQYPGEAAKTNVLGTLNVLEAAAAASVEVFVNVSTDKAANPTSVLGLSKRATERLTAQFALDTGRAYTSVRFGNVLGSRGSVLPSFQAQILAGGPITVTHPDVTRYFMTIPEAVQLVIQAGAIGRGGETLVLEMGQPVRIADVAKQMIKTSGKRIEIRYTGLRPGEKLDEELFSGGEEQHETTHPKISQVCVDRVCIADARGLAVHGEPQAMRDELVELAGLGRVPESRETPVQP